MTRPDETRRQMPANEALAAPSPPAAQASLDLAGGNPHAAGPFSGSADLRAATGRRLIGPRAAPFWPMDIWPFKDHRTLAQVDADRARIRRLFGGRAIVEIKGGDVPRRGVEVRGG